MNILWLVLIPVPLYFVAYRVYASYIARSYGEDAERKTPAIEINDGIDYCPTNSGVVFSHHFASIAGAGPILGPATAMIFGVGPVWLWLILGVILIGATHDYTALFISLRERGSSIAQVTRTALGTPAYAIMIGFTIIMLVLVTSAFLVASATALTSLVPLTEMHMTPDSTFLKTRIVDGVQHGKVGGIASTSVIIITLFAPLIGIMYYRKRYSVNVVVPAAILVCALSILVGVLYPVDLSPRNWMYILSVYTLIAAGLPVWFILQPRDFINVFILYGGIILLLVGIIFSGLQGGTLQIPLINIHEGQQKLGALWPIMFILVACGAISGFHALVAGGTVSKQVNSEPAARRIGYLGMLLESLFAVCVVAALAGGLDLAQYRNIMFPEAGRGNPILAFALGMSNLLNQGLHIPLVYGTIFGILMVEGFVATTLDTAIRLNRYLFEELWQMIFGNATPWWILRQYWFNSGLAVVLMLIFGLNNLFKELWPLFGTANQLLAAFTLIVAAAWMYLRHRKTWFLIIPAVFMTVTTVASLITLAGTYIETGKMLLGIADVVLLLLTVGLVSFSVNLYLQLRRKQVVEQT